MNGDRIRGSAILLWIALATLVPAFVLIRYGQLLFGDVPHIDDWLYIDRLRALESGELGLWQYVFERHNGHPSVPSRLAVLSAYHFADLDLGLLRWGMLIGQFCTAATAACLIVACARDGTRTTPEGNRLLESHAVIFGVPIVMLTALSLNEWETYAVATNFNNVMVTLFALGAVLTFHLWQANGRKASLLCVSIACALAASLSAAPGVLIWGALAAMAFLRPPRPQLSTGIAFAAVFVAFALLNAFAVSSSRVADAPLDVSKMLASAVMLVGLPWFSHIKNSQVVAIYLAFGTLLLPILAYAILRWLRASEEERAQSLPFLVLLGYGCCAIVLIAVGRRFFPIESIAASRYVGFIFPLVVGLAGLLGVAAKTSTPSRSMISGLFTLALVGWIVAANQEGAMAPYRVDATRMKRELLTSGALLETQVIRRRFFVDEYYAKHVIPRSVQFLRENKLSVFRER